VTPQFQALNELKKKHVKIAPFVLPTKQGGYHDQLIAQVIIEITLAHS
jgi:hypothetical protein